MTTRPTGDPRNPIRAIPAAMYGAVDCDESAVAGLPVRRNVVADPSKLPSLLDRDIQEFRLRTLTGSDRALPGWSATFGKAGWNRWRVHLGGSLPGGCNIHLVLGANQWGVQSWLPSSTPLCFLTRSSSFFTVTRLCSCLCVCGIEIRWS